MAEKNDKYDLMHDKSEVSNVQLSVMNNKMYSVKRAAYDSGTTAQLRKRP